MRFPFTDNTVADAQLRQFNGRTRLGFQCARCGEYQHTRPHVDWIAIPLIPFKEGGKKVDNCVIVCLECAKALGQDGAKTIPYSDLPYYDGLR